ncbi:chaperone modulator CbpM [Aequorivita sp. CIP111184]|uniref:chaperone modulator CbpM n=1 Tax=Aequorivita sp. CIP111184 TaxID=2211356 RepID=UPI000DBBD154|nr:chaperone modulator CbpM [Aequorivita sp. CIP111184]SRX55990.1 Chaperone modulatory protein CbpM [Aequorivita sp. CIP111184]
MAREKYILVSHFCNHTEIEVSFVENLQEYGLVTFEKRENDLFMGEKDITEIEKLFRLHHDLGINFEGLDAIKQMLKRMEKMEKQMDLLKKQLRLYQE